MEPTLALVPERGALAWPGNKTVSPDDGAWGAVVLPSPSPTETAWRRPSVAVPMQTGQLSPVSSGMDLPGDGCSSAPTTAHSTASSSCTDSWSLEYAERDDEEARWDHWERSSVDDALAMPKTEPVDDDDINLSIGKVTKGRSKTGCITCRKRKKKCDEAKPRCMNCEKNAVVCEGYHEKQLWRSGKERAEDERRRRESLPTVTLQPIFHGVETAEDQIFWRHYVNHFSNILTVEGEAKNAFKDMILQLANQHQGLMHSVLALSSRHMDLDSPYGANVLRSNPATTRESLQRRADHHHGEALKRLYEDIEKSIDKDDPEYQTVLAARYGQILCLLLETRADGNPRGEHRLHLQAYQSLIQHSPPEDTAFYTFITEFFQYHIYADDLLWHPSAGARRLSAETWGPSVPVQSPRLLGVADGLFQHLSHITSIRNTIRSNMAASVDPVVDYVTLFRAVDIDSAVKEWTPRWPPGDSRDRVAPLYKQMMWVYLFRTIYPPSGLLARRSTPPGPAASPMAPTPQRRASMAASVGAGPAAAGGPGRGSLVPRSCPSSRQPSRTSSMHELDSRHAAGAPGHGLSSPPPVRRPAHDDQRITLAVEESLCVLESFKPSDPAQTLLLIPCLIIGTACFEAAQRSRIRTAIRVVRGYTGLRNCDRVRELLEKVWSLMDEGNWLSVWDWQGVAQQMGLDFICA